MIQLPTKRQFLETCDITLTRVEWVKILLAWKGISRSYLAGVLGVSRGHMTRVLNGQKRPSAKLAAQMDIIFGLNNSDDQSD